MNSAVCRRHHLSSRSQATRLVVVPNPEQNYEEESTIYLAALYIQMTMHQISLQFHLQV